MVPQNVTDRHSQLVVSTEVEKRDQCLNVHKPCIFKIVCGTLF